MKYLLSFILLTTSTSLIGQKILVAESKNPFDKTLDKLTTAIEAKGLSVFSIINHHEGAKKESMDLDRTSVVIFGNPKVGTVLMNCDQKIGLELPLKILVFETPEKVSYLYFSNPNTYADQYDLDACKEIIEKITITLQQLVSTASQ